MLTAIPTTVDTSLEVLIRVLVYLLAQTKSAWEEPPIGLSSGGLGGGAAAIGSPAVAHQQDRSLPVGTVSLAVSDRLEEDN